MEKERIRWYTEAVLPLELTHNQIKADPLCPLQRVRIVQRIFVRRFHGLGDGVASGYIIVNRPILRQQVQHFFIDLNITIVGMMPLEMSLEMAILFRCTRN